MLTYPLEGNIKGFNNFLDLNKSGIYKLINLANGKFYIGSAINFRQRFKMHKGSLLRKDHYNTYLTRSVEKYGINNFEFQVLEFCEKKLLIKKEQFYIDTLKPHYNLCKIAGSKLGTKQTQETIDKRSKALKGKKLSESHKQSIRLSRIGKYLGKNHWNSKQVLQLDKNNIIINVFGSIAEAERLTGIIRTGINACVLGKTKTSGGYIWKYKNESEVING